MTTLTYKTNSTAVQIGEKLQASELLTVSWSGKTIEVYPSWVRVVSDVRGRSWINASWRNSWKHSWVILRGKWQLSHPQHISGGVILGKKKNTVEKDRREVDRASETKPGLPLPQGLDTPLHTSFDTCHGSYNYCSFSPGLHFKGLLKKMTIYNFSPQCYRPTCMCSNIVLIFSTPPVYSSRLYTSYPDMTNQVLAWL